MLGLPVSAGSPSEYYDPREHNLRPDPVCTQRF
jgi:hypothetical protein